MVLTGSLTRVVLADILRTWQVIPSPKGIVSIGDCARGDNALDDLYPIVRGKVFNHMTQPTERNYAIKGCPPSLEKIAESLLCLCSGGESIAMPVDAEPGDGR